MAESAAETSDDGFLGGRLLLRQPRRGHRAGHDAILLAASTAARPGQRIVDLGAGVGAAGLALASRVRGVELTLVEIDPALTALAALNARTNGLPARVIAADVTDPKALGDAGVAPDTFDGVLMNPPFHDAARHRASPDEARRIAYIASDETLPRWVAAAHRLLISRGSLTMIWRADGLADLLAAVGEKFGSLEIQPVHGVRSKPAVRILLRAVKGGRAPLLVHQPAILDGADATIEAAMRGEGVLRLAQRTQAGG